MASPKHEEQILKILQEYAAGAKVSDAASTVPDTCMPSPWICIRRASAEGISRQEAARHFNISRDLDDGVLGPGYRRKSLDSFDFNAIPKLNKIQVMELARCS